MFYYNLCYSSHLIRKPWPIIGGGVDGKLGFGVAGVGLHRSVVGRGRGVAQEAGGRLWPRPWRSTTSRSSADRDRRWPVAKPSTKVLNAKEKHKFV
jgi:hypothetical protein